MHVVMDFGRDERLELEVAEGRRIASRTPPAALADPAAAVRAALEAPHGFPPLRRALTPDDHVTVVLDEQVPQLSNLLVPLLEHVVGAGVSPEALTLVCPPSASRQAWLEDLPEAFEEVRLEVHDPTDRRRLAYLATTAGGKRIYLNRTVVDADQVVVLTGRRYDSVLGYAGAEADLYPALGDEATRKEVQGPVNFAVPGGEAWPVRREAAEVVWLFGQPFFVQVIAGPGDEVAHVVAGPADSGREGERLLDACWRRDVSRRADLVVAALSGDPARHTFADLAGAALAAARVVQPDGRIVLLSRLCGEPGPAADLLRGRDDPRSALVALQRHRQAPGQAPAVQWAQAAQQARLYLLSGLPEGVVEELFATPLGRPEQVQRLVAASANCLFLEDAHKTMAVVA
jgi:nickel-dependent lactate racemase